jgi:hypothetical protein
MRMWQERRKQAAQPTPGSPDSRPVRSRLGFTLRRLLGLSILACQPVVLRFALTIGIVLA